MKASKVVAAVILVSFITVMTSCATIVKGTSENLRVVTDPDSATVLIESNDGVMSQTKTAPCTFQLQTSKDYSLRVKMNNYQTRDIQLSKRISPWIAGNLLVWWILGLAVDFIDGAAWEHDTYIKVTLETKTSALPTDANIVAFDGNGVQLASFEVPLDWLPISESN